MLTAYVIHHARANRRASDGASTRAHWEAAAARGNVEAMKQLHGPEFPDALEYLYGWFHELSATRGEGVSGIAPITHPQIESWARITDREIAPHEVAALLEIDEAFRGALRGDEPPTAIVDGPKPVDAWPMKKRATVSEAADG